MTAALHWLYGKPRPARKPRPTLRQRLQHAYYMRNREKAKAEALARYHAKKAA